MRGCAETLFNKTRDAAQEFADPLFCDPVNDDYHVAMNSPAIMGKEVMGAYSEPGCGPKSQREPSTWRPLGARHEN
jgi:hypothetical protein